ncbi:sulfite oxidase [Bacillaceae bacterium S4-13-58]
MEISGQVSQPRFFNLNELLSMPRKSLLIPLECSGNKRAKFTPEVFGEQWQDGAISQGKWTGVPLTYLLELVGLTPNALEVLFQGSDYGNKPGKLEKFHFERSLPLEKALHPDTIIAFQYNDIPISFKHGYPLRLIVPNWYAMASVKWLNRIKVIDHHFTGPFQTEDYVYYPDKDSDVGQFPVTTINVNSIIQQPLDLAILETGTHTIQGIAWSGLGPISEVELSFDQSETWIKASLHPLSNQKYVWSKWSYEWKVSQKGEYTIYVRARDSIGRVQPITPFWNRKGYGYNAVSHIKVKVN